MTTINVSAGTKLYDSSPLIIGANRNHSHGAYGWVDGPARRSSILAAMATLKSNWGSAPYPAGQMIYRIGHGITDGRTTTYDSGPFKDQRIYDGYHYEAWWGKTKSDKAYGLYDDIQYGLQEALDMEATLVMVANIGSIYDTAETGRWAAFLNQVGNTQRADMWPGRANNDPMNVKYFELGNEISWKIERGHYDRAPSPKAYAEFARPHAAAIRANSDIPVKIAFVSNTSQNFTGNSQWGGPDAYRFCYEIITNSVFNGVQQCDALTIHGYPAYPLMSEAKFGTADQKMAMTTWVQPHIEEARRAIADAQDYIDMTYGAGTAKPVDIWNTEYFAHWYTYKDQSFAGSLYGIEGQMFAVRNGFPIAVPFCMWHNGNNSDEVLFYQGNPAQKTAWFKWMEKWSQNWGGETVEATLSNFPTKTVQGSSTTVTAPRLGVCAAKNADGSKLYLMVLNRFDDQDVPFDLNITGFSWDTSAPISYHKLKAVGDWVEGGWDGNNLQYLTNTPDASGDRKLVAERASVMLFVIPGAGQPAPSDPPAPTISGFSPTSGYPTQSVTITGTNFGANPGDNEVLFNGTKADVESVSEDKTQIVAIVPDGATDGFITVKVGTQTASSDPDSFDVTAAPAAPKITEFSPTYGEVGDTVTISGSDFDPTPTNNEVRFNGVLATVTGGSSTSLTTSVPSGASDGPITVKVGSQTATSSTDFDVVSEHLPTAGENGFGIRQAVLSGRTDADGKPDFLQKGTGLEVSLLAAQVPVVVAFAAGSNSNGTVDHIQTLHGDGALSWKALPASRTSYLFLERNSETGEVSTGFADKEPVYSAKRPSPELGKHWYDIIPGRMLLCTSVSLSSSFQDVSTAAGALSNGDASGEDKTKAFDDDTATNWGSSQTGSSIYGSAWIGNYFGGESHSITEIMLNQAAYPNRLSDVKFQVSDNGTSWTDVQNFSSLVSGINTLTVATPVAGKYARLIANSSSTTGANWKVLELEFRAEATSADSGTFDQIQRVFVGEATTDASTVTTLITYGLQGRFFSGRMTVSGGTNQTVDHNLGLDAVGIRIGLASTVDGSLNLSAATDPTLSPLTLTFGVPSGYVEADVVVERLF